MDNFFEVTETRGKGKDKFTTTTRYRRLTLDEMKNLKSGDHVKFLTSQGGIGNFKVTSVKTWKKRSDVHVGLKYGLYKYSYSEIIDYDDHFEHRGEFLVTEVTND